MPRSEEANQNLRDAQRANILACARNVFYLKGWSATMADIATEAGVSQGLAYRYFESKEQIFHELAGQALSDTKAYLNRVLEMPGSPGSRLEFLVSKILANRNRLMEFLQLHAQNRNRPDGLRDSFLEQGQAFHTVLLRLISEGQATGEVAQGDPEQLAVAITACLDGLSKYAFRNPEKFTALFPDAGIVLRMIKP